MKGYKEYMDGMGVSPELHEKLTNLTAPAKKPAWKKYGAIAAAVVLVVGLAGLGAAEATDGRLVIGGADGRTGIWLFDFLFRPSTLAPNAEPEIVDAIDIAPADPDTAEPGTGTKTIGGYEVRGQENGEETMVSYFMLPGIEYGEQTIATGASMDYSLVGPDGSWRDASIDDFLTILGCSEAALTDHLAWGGCTLTGQIGLNADGTAACAYLYGTRDGLQFELELCPGRLPPQCCIVLGQEVTTTEVWGVEVAGVKNVGKIGEGERGVYLDKSLRTEFLAHGTGIRATFYGTDEDALSLLMSRFVRWAVVEGLDLSGLEME